MAKRLSMFCLAVLLVAGALSHSSVAKTTHTVGGSIGWTIPSNGATAYTTWASQQNFSVGDVLVFNFTTNAHNVAEVTKTAFGSCSTSNPMSIVTTGPASINLTSAGEHYYICTFPTHCNSGQKLSINVSAASTSTPPTGISSTPPPPSTTATSSPPASATTLSSMSLPVAFLSVALAFFH